jgi:beta-lactam-binding protein with PASTA domain
VRVCPKCSFENESDADFCKKCNTYLRWDPTRVVQAVAPPTEEPEEQMEPVPTGPAGQASHTQTDATVTIVLPAPVQRPTYATPPAAGTAEVPGYTAEQVVVSLRLPDQEGAADAEVTATTEPGGESTLRALVRNQSGIVDIYDVEVTGVPEAWWTVVPTTVYLVPYGSPSGTYEDEVTIHFHPPRTEDAQAGTWPIEIVARSRAQPTTTASAPATLVVAPYEQLESELRPTTAAGRRKAEFAIMVRNRANAPTPVTVSGSDAEGVCTFEFRPPRFTAEPGRKAGSTFTVRPKKQIWLGRPVDRRLQVVARAAEGDAAAPTHHAVFRQKPWIPRWAAVLAPVAIAAGIVAYTQIPKKTTVPVLRGQTPAAAQAALQKAGLKLSPEPPVELVAHAAAGTVVRVVPPVGSSVKRGTVVVIRVAEPKVPTLVGRTQEQARLALQTLGLQLSPAPPRKKVSSKKAGTIVAQVPGAGRSVKSGTQISIQIAVGSGKRRVPNVVGMTLADAEKAIRAKGLTMAPLALPQGVNAAKAKISLQIPSADEVVDAKEQVRVFVPPPPKPKATIAPAIGGLGAAAAVAALAKVGVGATQVRIFDTAPAGAVVGQSPPKGTRLKPGAKVQLTVSAGYPEIAYSDGSNLRLMQGSNGATIKTLAGSADLEDQPSWQANGALVAYRRGPASNFNAGKIWLLDVAKPSGARQLTTGTNDRRPAFSPNGAVVAFIRKSSSDGDLCFARVSATPTTGACIVDPSISVDRPTWAPDGRAILVVAVDPKDPNQTELLEYTSTTPFSTRPGDWVSQGLVTDAMHGKRPGEGLLYAAWSPAGNQVAVAANWGAGNLSFFHVFLIPASQDKLGRATSVVPQIRACEVAWRPDSRELAVTQADDCSKGLGSIVRVDPAKPTVQTPLRPLGAENPTWQFITLAGR